MKYLYIAALTTLFSTAPSTATGAEAHGYPINPVSFTSVKVDDPLWSPRLQAARDITVPLAFSKCEESGRY